MSADNIHYAVNDVTVGKNEAIARLILLFFGHSNIN